MKTKSLKIAGMSCGGCTSKVALALESIVGVNEVKVSLSDGEAMVHYDESMTSPEHFKAVVNEAGFSTDLADIEQKQEKKGCCHS